MFKRVLIANRGEIAVRILRTYRDLGIEAVTLFDASDRGSLHVRLADQSVPLRSPLGYLDGQAVIQLARETGADAIHPGYGFLAEHWEFVRACEDAGIAFIGPPSRVVATLRSKLDTLAQVEAAGFTTPARSSRSFGEDELQALRVEAGKLGYPLVVKSCRGGRGRGTRIIGAPAELDKAVHQAQAEAQMVYGDMRVYLEQAILPAHAVEVQVLGDHHGRLIHLGERDGTLQHNNRKVFEEAPAPSLTEAQRHGLWQKAIEIARLFGYRNAGAVEFLLDTEGRVYFTEVKARIQVGHPVTEMVSTIDIVREQTRIAAGEPLAVAQEDVNLRGWAMQCRINAEDPWNNFLPSPGRLSRFRLPGGPHVRVDTYAYSGCEVPVRYDPLLANLVTWGENRDECIRRMRRALQDFLISGVQTNGLLHQRILSDPPFVRGDYTAEIFQRLLFDEPGQDVDLRYLAVAAAIAYARRRLILRPSLPDRLRSGWHRDSRRLPE
jgi:acetyl-CoA carboxylase, biotin carboxylase subunit